MIKITVLYNLPEGTDEEAFLRWRTIEHNAANAERPGVIKSDFYRVIGQPAVGRSGSSPTAPYRFITESYWPDIETFEADWNEYQERLRLHTAVERITDALFLVSEEIQSTLATPDGPQVTNQPYGNAISPVEPLT